MMNNKFLIILVVSTSVVLVFMTLINRWVASQIIETPTSAPVSKQKVSKIITDIPRPPMIDPDHDPLAPMIQPAEKKPVTAPARTTDIKKVYEFPMNEVLIQ